VSLFYAEWSAPEGSDPDDPAVLRMANPSMPYGRITEEFSVIERAAKSDEEYARERLGIFPDHDNSPQWLVVAEHVWRHKAAAEKPPEEGWLTGTVSLAVERSEIGTASPLPWSVCVAGTTHDGLTGIDVLGRFEDDRKVIELLVAATQDDTHPVSHVVIDLASPAAAIVEPLRAAGVEVNTDITARLLAATTTRLIDELTDGRTVHRSNPDLDAAVSVARLRKFGESKVIDRWTGHDSTPFIGCDLAVWGHQNQPAPAPPGFAMILGGP